jgi:4-amino-4-deoxy-L-arabinose transferase-like glycosyltransferase
VARQTASPPTTPSWGRWLMLAVIAAAFAVRVYRLDTQSLWYDEGFSAQVALGSFSGIFSHAGTDPHPPLYHTLLWLWTRLAGAGEFSLRFFSVAAGVASVALLYRLGTQAGGSLLGLVAAILAVANPFLVHYSQEARMYSLFTALSLASTVCLLRAFPAIAAVVQRRGEPAPGGGESARPEPVEGPSAAPLSQREGPNYNSNPRSMSGVPPWLWYSLATAALLLTHYFAVFLVAAHGIWAYLAFGRPAAFAWLKHAVLAGVAIIPWLAHAAPILVGYTTQAATPVPAGAALQQVLVAFTTGVVPPDWPGGLATRFIPAAAVAGMVVLATQRRPRSALLAVLCLAAPLVGLYALAQVRPTFNPRYVIPALPFLLLLAAALPVAFGSRFGAIAVALGVAFSTLFLPPLQRAATDPELARHNWRTLAEFVLHRAGPDDVFVFNAWYAQFVFDYYAQGPQPRIGARTQQPLDSATAAELLNRAGARCGRLWLVLWQDEVADPGGYLPATAEASARVVEQRWDGPLRVFAYETPSGAVTPYRPLPPPQPAAANLAGEIALEGYTVDRTEVAPGDTLKVVLYWRSLKPVADDYRGFVHLLARDLLVYGQLDKVTIGFYHPTSHWRAGELLRDEYAFQVDPQAPPGDYLLEAGMYTHPDAERRPIVSTGLVSVSPGGVALPQRITVRAR